MDKKLNIAIMNSPNLPVPPYQGYGGTQRGIYDFLTHMNGKGHRLHLFGSGDSDVSGLENVVLTSFIEQSLWVPENTLSIEEKKELEQEHYDRSLEVLKEIDRKEGVDIINLRKDNVVFLQELVDNFGSDRIVYSLHNVKDQAVIDTIQGSGVQCIAHCRNHREQHENLQNIKIIIYGINVDTYPFSRHTITTTPETPNLEVLRELKERNEDYLISLSGIGKHKGQKTCIELAREADMPLIIAGAPQNWTSDEKKIYFEEQVVPYIDRKRVIYFGNADEEQKKELLKHAKGFLFPSGYEDNTWNEPFGRAPVEALASGTPVIAYRKGSMPEVIFDSFNGFLFDSTTEAIGQIKRLDEIDRMDCRRTVEKKFNSRRVSDEYEILFHKMLSNPDA